MEIVLLERVAKLGQMGEVVNVKQGYARNFLLPKGKALRATKANMARFETERAQLEARNLDARKEAETVHAKLDGQQFVVIRSASDTGALYGSVTPRDAAEIATEEGFTLDRNQILLERPIKELGLHRMEVVLHPEVSATITVNVARSAEEAELQASGKTILEAQAEADAEADIDIADLFDEVGAAAVDMDELEGAVAEAAEEASDEEPAQEEPTEPEPDEENKAEE